MLICFYAALYYGATVHEYSLVATLRALQATQIWIWIKMNIHQRRGCPVDNIH